MREALLEVYKKFLQKWLAMQINELLSQNHVELINITRMHPERVMHCCKRNAPTFNSSYFSLHLLAVHII